MSVLQTRKVPSLNLGTLRFHLSKQRLQLSPTGEIKGKDNFFRPGVYSFFSKVGQFIFAPFGYNSLSEDNLKISLKTFLANSSTGADIKFKTKSLLSSTLDLNKLKNQHGSALTQLEWLQVKVEIAGIKYAFKEYLMSYSGTKCKEMLNKISSELISQANFDSVAEEDSLLEVLNGFSDTISAREGLNENDIVTFITLCGNDFKDLKTLKIIKKLGEIGQELQRKLDNPKQKPPYSLEQDFKKALSTLKPREQRKPISSSEPLPIRVVKYPNHPIKTDDSSHFIAADIANNIDASGNNDAYEVDVAGYNYHLLTFNELIGKLSQQKVYSYNSNEVLNDIITTTEEIVSHINFLTDYYTKHNRTDWINRLNECRADSINTATQLCAGIVKNYHYSLTPDSYSKYNLFRRMMNIDSN
ncbi:MAG: hypothetical protein QG673_905 [Pseudomonadota bacterium]|nr:hypothetical protein [Pseudomonadota bacterium]